ncbi:MAG: U3 snoRNP protein [Vezdaea aestivalis]|nr:MAG: U3 snoRNP protein [Vezdaea aestivalis]
MAQSSSRSLTINKKRRRSGTVSAARHRHKSFSQRITEIRVKGIRKDDVLLSDARNDKGSHFQTFLERAEDTNLSEDFTAFARKCSPLCESLAHVLHNQDQIVDLLLQHISHEDAFSLQPLLELVACLAQDLRTSFEKCFPLFLERILDLAARQRNPEVIEWSFDCTARIFKHLVRLLVPDLRPTFDILSPYLGRERQSRHTAVFAAEALSFLVRKATLSADKDALKRIIEHILHDVELAAGERNVILYKMGIMTLFAESCKGVNLELHYCAAHLLNKLMNISETRALAYEIICGVITNLAHHTDTNTFEPVVLAITSHIRLRLDTEIDEPKANELQYLSQVVFALVATRSGLRIGKSHWHELIILTRELSARVCGLIALKEETCLALVKATSAVLILAPLESVAMKTIRPMTDDLLSDNLFDLFPTVCIVFAETDTERFQLMITPLLSKFADEAWPKKRYVFLGLISKLQNLKLFNSGENLHRKKVLSDNVQSSVIDAYEHLGKSILENRSDQLSLHDMTIFHSLFQVLSLFKISESRESSIESFLPLLAIQALKAADRKDYAAHFGRGTAFIQSCLAGSLGAIGEALWPQICSSSQETFQGVQFLNAVLHQAETAPPSIVTMEQNIDRLSATLCMNLRGGSHELRRLSLKTIIALSQVLDGSVSDLLQIAQKISEMEFTFGNARSISLLIRSISTGVSSQKTSPLLRKYLVNYIIGLMTVRLSIVTDDAIIALQRIAETPEGESIISDVVFQQLHEVNSLDKVELLQERGVDRRQVQSGFDCSALLSLDFLIENARESCKVDNLRKFLERAFASSNLPIHTKEESTKTNVLRVLEAIPAIAEKKSRLFVPFYLQWSQSGNLQEQKVMLKTISQFRNPKVLFRTEELYKAILRNLTRGDSEIQAAALRSIFTWKDKNVIPYKEHLLNLLDDAHFREEIALFVRQDDSTGSIQAEHRESLLPILLRLLFGRLVSRRGPKKAGDAFRTKRESIIQALTSFQEEEIKSFVQVSLEGIGNIASLDPDTMKRKEGFLNVAVGFLENLGPKLQNLEPIFTGPILGILFCNDTHNDILSIEETNGQESQPHASSNKNVKREALRCLNLLFSNCPAKEWQLELPGIYKHVFEPDISHFHMNNAHSTSTTLRLLQIWASDIRLAIFLTGLSGRIFEGMTAILGVLSGSPEVKMLVLDSVQNICMFANNKEQEHQTLSQSIREDLLLPRLNSLLGHITMILKGSSPSAELLEKTISTLSHLAIFINSDKEATNFLVICASLLDATKTNKSTVRISPKTKSELLKIASRLMKTSWEVLDSETIAILFSRLSSLFGFFKDIPNRSLLTQAFETLALADPKLVNCAQLCTSLNSASGMSLSLVDFEKCSKAFQDINSHVWLELDPKTWKPILHSAIFHMKNSDEVALRFGASLTLRRFIDRTSTENQQTKKDIFDLLVSTILMPAFRDGILEESELVRMEFLNVIAHAVKMLPTNERLGSMRSLLVNDDPEASFFNNILHIQQHRRLRALRRLVSQLDGGAIDPFVIRRLLIPLVEHFIFSKNGSPVEHNLSNESINALGFLAGSLEWAQFLPLFKTYLSFITSKKGEQKIVIKAISAFVDAYCRAMQPSLPKDEAEDAMVLDVEGDTATKKALRLAETIPQRENSISDIAKSFLEPMTRYLNEKEEDTVTFRAPLAVSVVKLLMTFPVEEINKRLPPILTDVCHILRSRSQDSRNLTRKTLAEIATIIGPPKFSFILNELRGALLRGYQLHVLSFTVHSMLVSATNTFGAGTLDYCANSIMSIIMDDVFGPTGQEKDAEDYISQMIEVKKPMSYDSFQILTKVTSITEMPILLRPLQTLLQERLNYNLVKKVDALLDRFCKGIEENRTIQDEKVLVLCYELVQDVYKSQSADQNESMLTNSRNRRYLLNLKGSGKEAASSANFYSYKMIEFALRVFRSVMKRNESLLKPAYVTNFMPIIGDSMLHPQEEVQISAVQILTLIISENVAVPDVEKFSGVYLSQAVRSIEQSSSINSVMAQSSLKLITTILQKRPEIQIKELWVVSLLKLIQPELLNHGQKVSFEFIRALMNRDILVAEMYDVADAAASIMVTSHSDATRKHARDVYLAFFTRYTQKKERRSKQLSFLAKNLEYLHHEGRLSVLEIIHRLVKGANTNNFRNGDATTHELFSSQDINSTFFVPLTMMMVNDESEECREGAAMLLKQVFLQSDGHQIQAFKKLFQKWTHQDQQKLLMRAGIQGIHIYLSSREEVDIESRTLSQILDRAFSMARTRDEDYWDITFYSLKLFHLLCEKDPAQFLSAKQAALWSSCIELLNFPHLWVKHSASALVEVAINDIARSNLGDQLGQLPLQGEHGLQLVGENLLDVTASLLRVLNSQGVSRELAMRASRILLFLGRCFALNQLHWRTAPKVSDDYEVEGAEEEEDPGFSPTKNRSALTYLFQRISWTLRRVPVSNRAPSLIHKTVSLQLIGALCHHISPESIKMNIHSILLPLSLFTDLAIAAPQSTDKDFTEAHDNLSATSHELIALLQDKLGTSDFVQELGKVRRSIKERREARRTKRRIEIVANPERAGKEKRRKGEQKREKRKERNMDQRGKRRGW